jgi:hypothetical protein
LELFVVSCCNAAQLLEVNQGFSVRVSNLLARIAVGKALSKEDRHSLFNSDLCLKRADVCVFTQEGPSADFYTT